jgi:adenosylcobyric acid synthase
MSNNAAVTAEGGEIGRAQALQARACGVAPSVDMNPVLLKPQSEIGAQIVVHGRVVGTARARDTYELTPRLLSAALDSFARLRSEADLVLIEGAGSAAEVNLRERDIANMDFARRAADFLKREARNDVEAAVARHAKRLGVAPRRSALALLYRC